MKILVFLVGIVLLSSTSCATRVVTTAPTQHVVVVKKAPRNHKVVVIKGNRYYRWGGKHYRKTHGGFVVAKF